ncbi:MAG TPA: peptide chain release factor N(5)-glutamine methyltransferase [Ignavibacteria bacterium]|nr:peptide chain release factor N(5)-glutamine methyltransferase [Ignavibacteria bacterium]HMQ99230.1 peptide chain release factor N(5)-glutamine methyltransferase [Ignavibacteria bacterium]
MKEIVKTWTVLDILKVTEAAFRGRGISNPRLNAELLLADTTGDSRINLYLNFEKPLTESEVSDYRNRVKRRLKFEPLQYIRGKTEFYGLEFNVTPDVLIPRQETEILVEKVLEYKKVSGIKCPKILEIGTGSGCISISIAANSECQIRAFDVSTKAIVVAQLNSLANNTTPKIQFDTLDFFSPEVTFEGYDIILSNPPYISAQDVPGLNEEVNAYEPYIALTDDGDGLSFYKRIFELYNTSQNKPAIFLEIGDGKKEDVTALMKKNNITKYALHKDLMNMPRVLEIEGTVRK